MPGAAILSGLGALRSGAGLLTMALPESIRRTVSNRLPEAMTINPSEIPTYVRRRTITTLAVGPGLGVGMQQKKLVLALMRMNLPMVLDADGLNNISSTSFRRKLTIIITPHPGELAKLLGKSVKEIQKDRVRSEEH